MNEWKPVSEIVNEKNIDGCWMLVKIQEKETGLFWVAEVMMWDDCMQDWYNNELGWLNSESNEWIKPVYYCRYNDPYTNEEF